MPNLTVLFLKEPGKSITVSIRIPDQGRNLKEITPGTELTLKSKNRTTQVFYQKTLLAEIGDEATNKRVAYALEKKYNLKVYAVKAGKQQLELLLRCDKAIFLSKKAPEIKPFTKHGDLFEEDREDQEISDTNEAADANDNETSTPPLLNSQDFISEVHRLR